MAKRRKTKKKSDASRKLAVEAACIADRDNCEGVVVLDLRGISPITDYFVIATGTSDRQMQAVAQDIEEYGKGVGQRVWQTAGLEAADWIVMDFVDVVVHLFDRRHRAYYDLELIWGESPKVRWHRRKTKVKTAEKADME